MTRLTGLAVGAIAWAIAARAVARELRAALKAQTA